VNIEYMIVMKSEYTVTSQKLPNDNIGQRELPSGSSIVWETRSSSSLRE